MQVDNEAMTSTPFRHAPPAHANAGPSTKRTVGQVLVVLATTAVAAGGLLLMAFAVSLCGLFGEQCSAAEDSAIAVAFFGSIVTGIVGVCGALVVSSVTRPRSWATIGRFCGTLIAACVVVGVALSLAL